jgi:DNA-binding IclR family transcriptional regulator
LASSVEKTFKCIEAIAGAPSGLTVSEVAAITGLSRPAATRLLDGLAADSIMVRDEPTKRYRLGLRLYEWAVAGVQASTPINIARKELVKLCLEADREFNLLVVEGNEAVLLERFENVDGIVINRPVPGRRVWYQTATGKAIVAFSEQSRLSGKRRSRRNGRLSNLPKDLDDEMEVTHERGYALSHEVRAQGSIGVPILGQSGGAVAAIGTFINPGEDEVALQPLIAQMTATANRISHYLGHRSAEAVVFT